jgi:hypothetical protein
VGVWDSDQHGNERKGHQTGVEYLPAIKSPCQQAGIEATQTGFDGFGSSYLANGRPLAILLYYRLVNII